MMITSEITIIIIKIIMIFFCTCNFVWEVNRKSLYRCNTKWFTKKKNVCMETVVHCFKGGFFRWKQRRFWRIGPILTVS